MGGATDSYLGFAWAGLLLTLGVSQDLCLPTRGRIGSFQRTEIVGFTARRAGPVRPSYELWYLHLLEATTTSGSPQKGRPLACSRVTGGMSPWVGY